MNFQNSIYNLSISSLVILPSPVVTSVFSFFLLLAHAVSCLLSRHFFKKFFRDRLLVLPLFLYAKL